MSTLNNPQQDAKDLHPRFKLLYVVITLSAVLIFSRLWHLQIIKGHELWVYSNQNRVKKTKIPAPRGVVLDREGRVLVDNLPGFEATLSPQYATRLEETAEAIGPVLNIKPQKIINMVKLSVKRNGKFRPVTLKENLSLDEVYHIQSLRFDHPGLSISEAIIRHYPLHENGAQLFGYVGEISKKQIPRFNKKYSGKYRFEQGDIIGKSGLEETWEESLKGLNGLSFLEVDAYGRLSDYSGKADKGILGLDQQNAIPGHNLVLTIDKDIQQATFAALLREDRWAPRVGSVLVMKANGEILAWASVPSYDPNEFSLGISNQLWNSLREHPFKPLRNKIVQDHFAPGSTLKPIIALAALQEKEIDPYRKVYAPGSMRYGRRTYHDSIRAGHGNINIMQAIERSSNIFFFKLGIQLGIDRMAKYAQLFGLGQKTNINISGEEPGLFPTKEWKQKRKGEPWQPGENLSNAIGQGFVLTTSIQMAVAYNAIGLEGEIYQPFLVKKIIDPQNRLIKEFKPNLIRNISESEEEDAAFIDKKHFKTVKEGMRLVANGERGTARHWKIPGLEMAGKTGTSQVMSFSADEIYKKCESRPIHQRHHATYVSYAPATKPEITIAVMVEHGCHGNTAGAPVARDIFRAYFEKYHPEMIKKKKPVKKVAKVEPPKEESSEDQENNEDEAEQ